MGRKSTKNLAKVSESLKTGATLEASLLAGGYSDSVAKRGLAAVEESAPLKRILIETGQYQGLANRLTPEQIKDFVSAKLLENAIDGKDKAAKSLELLGKQRGVDMFSPDQIVGGLILNVPDSWQHLFGSSQKQSAASPQKQRKTLA
jgi:hypothetical protein